MVRRRPSQKKNRHALVSGGFNKRKQGKSSIKGWETRDDIPLDDEERFHANKDKILLEGEVPSDEDALDEDEVFALEGFGDSASDEDDDHPGATDDYEDDEDLPLTSRSKKAKKSKPSKVSNEDEDKKADDDDDRLERWGSSKSVYYSSNQAELSSDDEEGNELEENEVKRIQAKARELITEADYGIDEVAWGGDEAVASSTVDVDAVLDDKVSEKPNTLINKDKTALIRQLEIESPETLALARDWEDVAHSVISTRAALEACDANHPALGLMHLHYQTLLTYATTLAFYLHLRASKEFATQPSKLRSHPVIGRLLTLKQALTELEALGFSADDEDDDDSLSDSTELDLFKRGVLPPEELLDLMADRAEAEKLEQEEKLKIKIVKPQKAKEKSHQEEKSSEKSTRKQKEKKKKEDKPVFDLVEPVFTSDTSASSSKWTLHDQGDSVEFGDPTALADADAKDKAAKRKSLRFYTSKIESTSQRREKARSAVGGDDDLPYRSKKKDVIRKGLGEGGADLDGEDETPELSSKKRSRDEDQGDGDEGSNDEGYYDLVKRRKKEKKEAKQRAYEAKRDAERIDYTEPGKDGPRGLTRMMMKNKTSGGGKRTKDTRNPRVKKKVQYEKAKKKVSSMKATYKGDHGESYSGERSGISKVVKSVRL